MTRVLAAVGLAVLVLVIIPLGVAAVLLAVAADRPFHDERTLVAPPGGVVVHPADAAVTIVPSRDAAVHVTVSGTFVLTRPLISVSPAAGSEDVAVSGCLRCAVAVTVAAPPSAPVGVDSSSRSVTAVGVDAPLRLSSGRGPITGRDLGSPQVQADTGRGDIALALRRPGTVAASAGRGTITITAPPTAAYSLDPSTGSGSVLATLPDAPGSPFHLSARTGRGDVVLSP